MGKWVKQGFVANSLQAYKDQLVAAFREAYGDDFITDDETPQGILIQRIAELLYNTDMDGVEVFSRMNLNSMSGVFLDMVGAMRGIYRSLGTPQQANVSIKCSSVPFTIPAGTIFTVVGTEETFTLPTATTISVPDAALILTYSQSGNSSAIVGGKMQTTNVSQIQDITITGLVNGQGRETDIEYRRRLISEYPAANNTIEWVKNKILENPLVRVVGAEYNDTAETQGTIPPYCTEWMAVPKDGADLTIFKNAVAKIILDNKVPGSPTHGNTTVENVEDIFGTKKTVKFTVPDKIDLQIEVLVTTPEGTGFLDLSNVETICDGIKDYINNLEIGVDVSFSRAASGLFADPGFDVQSFKIKAKTDSSWVTNGNYTIGPREYAHIEFGDINIGI